MAKIYADLCVERLRTCIGAEGITPVPDRWLQSTITELTNRGKVDLVPESTL